MTKRPTTPARKSPSIPLSQKRTLLKHCQSRGHQSKKGGTGQLKADVKHKEDVEDGPKKEERAQPPQKAGGGTPTPTETLDMSKKRTGQVPVEGRQNYPASTPVTLDPPTMKTTEIGTSSREGWGVTTPSQRRREGHKQRAPAQG